MDITVRLRDKMFALCATLALLGCVKDSNFDEPSASCSNEVFETISLAQLKGFYTDKTIQIQDDLVITGYVISSDKEGNFFNVLHFQDKPNNPTEGLQIEIELRDSHLFFGVGQQIYIKLKGLYLGKSKGVFKIGGVFTSFGNISVGRLPSTSVFKHILVTCQVPIVIEPTEISIDALNESRVNTLVKIDNVEFIDAEIGLPFAVVEEETNRNLIDCDANELALVNSGFADFQAETIPEKRGSITGIVSLDNTQFQLIIRELEDVAFDLERCEEVVDEFTSTAILITELADPDNNAGARFVELYNAATEPLSLKGWRLVRYTNANLTVSSTIDLSDETIEGKGFIVISPNAPEFESVYGFAPTISAGINSPADSNGDDNLVLVDPFGEVIDIFGVIGEDGSGTDHEFEDGRAIRKSNIVNGNPIFTASEWEIFNDSGGNGTLNNPQNAPMDFTPGIR
ncbi:MAG: DUF5689 domain-containing protein [Maribacter sp.]